MPVLPAPHLSILVKLNSFTAGAWFRHYSGMCLHGIEQFFSDRLFMFTSVHLRIYSGILELSVLERILQCSIDMAQNHPVALPETKVYGV